MSDQGKQTVTYNDPLEEHLRRNAALTEEVGRLREQLDAAHQRVGEADAQRMVAIRKNDERVRELEVVTEQLDAARQVLERIAGSDPKGLDGIHFVGDAYHPDECPGCIARAALGVVGPPPTSVSALGQTASETRGGES